MKNTKRIICLFLMVTLIASMLLPVTVSGAGKTAVSLNKKTATIYVGSTLQLKLSGAKGTVKWSTSSKKVATVSAKGLVKGAKAGTAKITAKAGKTSATCKVTVKNPEINKKSVSVYVGATYTLKLLGTTIKSVKTSKSSVATVSKKGVVTGKKAGTATITLTGKNSKKYTCKVTVKNTTINQKTLTLQVGKTYTLKLTGTAIKSVKSSSSSIALVGKDGKVTAKKPGTATITLVGKNGLSHTCKVTVKPILANTVTIGAEDISLFPEDTIQLDVQVLPGNVTDGSVTWSSSDETVAVVTDGLITAVAEGTCTITATANDASGKSDSVSLTVKPMPVKTVTLSKSEAALWPGDKITLLAIAAPDSAVNKNIIWKSSDEAIATVKDGEVTALTAGVVTITAEAEYPYDNTAFAQCTVTVNPDSVIVQNIDGLKDAVADEHIKTVILDSATTERLVIPAAHYSNVSLIINVPNGEVENNATWKEVHIQAISPDTYIENCQDNELYFEAEIGTITITSNAKAKIYIVGATDVSGGQPSRSLTVIDNSNSSLVSGVELQCAIKLTVTGDNSHTIDVAAQNGAEGSVIETNKKVDFKAEAKVQLVLEAGAEGSVVSINSAESLPEIKGLGFVPVTNESTGDETVVVAENNGAAEIGTITIKGSITVDNAAIYLLPYDSSVSVSNAAEKVSPLTPITSSADSQYTITNCALGNYTLVIIAEGYMPVVNTIIITSSTADGATYQNNSITMISEGEPGQDEANSSISGNVIDSVTGKNVTFPVALNLRAGFNNMTGEAIASVVSTDGTYNFGNLTAGYYTIQAQSAGDEITIASNTINVIVLSGKDVESSITVTKTLSAGQVQFVLHWYDYGVNEYVPSDLDSHLVGPVPDGTRFHTWYMYQGHYYGEERYADLDVDDIDYEGPETTTIYTNVDGLYSFYVFDFSNQSNEECNYMSDYSGAYVEIKSGNTLIDTVYIPTEQKGNLWHVADYDSATGKFTRVNTVGWWMSGGSEYVGRTEKEVLEGRLADRIEALQRIVNKLSECEAKTEAENLLARANELKNKSVSGEEVTSEEFNDMISELDQCGDNINIAFNIIVGGSYTNWYVSNNNIYILTDSETPGEYTVSATDNYGNPVTVEWIAETDEATGMIGKATIKSNDARIVRQYVVYLRMDYYKLFAIARVTGKGVTDYVYDIYYDDDGEQHAYLDVYGLEPTLPDDLSITPAKEGITVEIRKDDEGKVTAVLTKGELSVTCSVHYYHSNSVFYIDDLNCPNIILREWNIENGTVILHGLNADLSALTVTFANENVNATVSLDEHPNDCDGVITVTYGDYSYNYNIYYKEISDGITALSLDQDTLFSISNGHAFASFTPEVTGRYTIVSFGDTTDPYVRLCDSEGNYLAGNDDGGENWNFRLSYNLTAGNTYYYDFRDNASSIFVRLTESVDYYSTFDIVSVSGSGIISYTDEIYNDDDEQYYGRLEIYGIPENLPDDLTVTPALDDVDVQITKDDEDDTFVTLKKGEFSLRYRVYYYRNSYNFEISDISFNNSLSTSWNADGKHGVININGFNSDLSTLEITPYNGFSEVTVSFDEHTDDCDGVCTVSYEGYTYKYYIYYKNVAEEAPPLTVGQETTPEFSDGRVYVSFTPDEDGMYNITSYSTNYNGDDPNVRLYDSDLNQLAYDDDDGEGWNFSLSYNLTAGKTYYYYLTSYADPYSVILTKSIDYYSTFDIVSASGSGIISYTDEIYNDDGEQYYGQLEIYGVPENLPDDLTVTPALDDVDVQIVKDDEDYTFVILKKGDFSLRYRVYYYRDSYNFEISDISFNNSLSTSWNADGKHGVININGFNSDLSTLEITPYNGFSEVTVSFDEHPEGCDGVCTVSYDGNSYEYYIYYENVAEEAPPLTVGQETTPEFSDGRVYVSFTPDEDGTYNITSYSTNYNGDDPKVRLYDSALNQLAYDDDDGEGWNFSLSYDLIAGKTYYYYLLSDSDQYPVILTKEG